MATEVETTRPVTEGAGALACRQAGAVGPRGRDRRAFFVVGIVDAPTGITNNASTSG